MSTQQATTAPTIFSSDGLPPIPVPQPYQTTANIPSSTDGTSKTQCDDAVEETYVSPHDAFEMFSGKIFSHDENRVNKNTTTAVKIKETPLQRLNRLKREISELEKDLSSSHFSDTDPNSELLKLTQELSSRLSFNPSLRQNELTSVVSNTIKDVVAPTPSKDDATEQQPIADTTTPPLPPHVFERLSQLERILGNGIAADTTGLKGTILERLEKAEGLVRGVDSQFLEKAANRAKIIRADWEAAAKTRSKLATTLNSASNSSEDTKMISHLYDNMRSLEGVSHQLPLIINRLTGLSQLHLQANDFAGRLAGSERCLEEVERLVKGLENTLERVEEGLGESLTVVEKNLEDFDERFKKLEGV
mmetsp:Transcript_9050/g.11120  ORF Transcript_9050/g.11120 Transcript_9050/m.11120 type:complete len:362 (+) Transcript_9050:101-1186(+)|eukprot:CAMPEP_0172497272 /NCGR_PEP_ID=MMETSP1066-20121228/97440_1 /TAXON_ID=671091 /ORGANISM="Coscinodiscus wailesii, Strain CCMP2513" /LENGTH=361 /DNA_ID=CAMNT_0013269935 /DNA_START=100 /DNA_END=1185 /DNA_ORIENTATION=+